jgi:hypothetical protein
MEGDGPKLPMVLYKYVRVLETLRKKRQAAHCTVLEPMFDLMIKITEKYIDRALKCDTVILATFLHPSWRMMLFNKRFGLEVQRINKLIQSKFDDQDAHLNSLQPEPLPQKDSQSQAPPSDSECDGDEFNFYPENPESLEANTEIQRYIKVDFPMDKKGCVLGWWKVG